MDSIGRRGAAGVQAAAAVQEAPLAVYPLAQRQINSLFTAAINHLLQNVISGSKRTTSYLHATTHQQQHCAVALEPGDTWGKAIDRMGIENTQLLMYVKPVADPSDFCGEAVQGVTLRSHDTFCCRRRIKENIRRDLVVICCRCKLR